MDILYRFRRLTTLLLLMSLSLAACTTTGQKRTPAEERPASQVTKKASPARQLARLNKPLVLKRDEDRVLLYAEIDANRHSASRVNLVFIHANNLVPEVSRLSAREWFARREQLSRSYPKALSVISATVIPGERKHLQRFTKRQRSAAMIVVFSSYLSEGEHKIIISPDKLNYVYFMKNHFMVK